MHRIASRALRATFCTALATALCVPALAASSDYLLVLDGIEGVGGQADKHKDQIEILSYSWGESRAIGSATGGAGAGKVKFNEFTIKKTTDKASPMVMKGSTIGENSTETTGGVSVAAGDLDGDGTAAPRKPTISRATISPKSLPGSAGANQTLAVGSNQTESGLPTGKRQHKPFTLTQPLDKGSITVRMRAAGSCTVGKRYAGAQFSAAGQTYVLSDLHVADCGETSTGPTEEITFVYGKLIVRGWDPEKKEQ